MCSLHKNVARGFYGILALCVLCNLPNADGQDVANRARIREAQRLERLTRGFNDSERTIKTQFEAGVVEELEAMTRVCGLTESQRAKLQLASRGDLVQTLDRFEDIRRLYLQDPYDEGGIEHLLREREFLEKMAGHFGDYSLFYKTLRKMLTDEQQSKYHDIERRRQEAMIGKTLGIVERQTNVVLFNDEQRRQITLFLLEKGTAPTTVTPYSHVVVFLQAVPHFRSLQDLMDKSQYDAFVTLALEARKMEHVFRMNGVLPPNEDVSFFEQYRYSGGATRHYVMRNVEWAKTPR